ncbi:ZBED5 protein, partial [Polyodon spathula]|nr:ZBED5 protein [Polyodon spathula]
MACKKVLRSSAAADDNIKALEASYLVSYRVAKSGKPHTIAKELILPAAADMVSTMLGEKAQKVIQLVPLSNNTVPMVNFIKARPLNSRIFSDLCNEMGSKHVNLLLHTEVRWLSRGKALARFFELHSEVKVFFTDHPFPLSHCLHDTDSLSRLGYLSDIFSRLNKLNLGLPGLSATIFNVQDKIEAMIKKLEF